MYLANNLIYYKNRIVQLRLECNFIAKALSDIVVNLYFFGKVRERNAIAEPVVLLVGTRIYQSYLYLMKFTGIIPAIEIVVAKNIGAVRKCLEKIELKERNGTLIICGQLYTEHHSVILSNKIGRKALII